MSTTTYPFLQIAVESGPCNIGIYQNGAVRIEPFGNDKSFILPKKVLETPSPEKPICLDDLSWNEIDKLGHKARDYFELGAIKHDTMKDGTVAIWRITDFDHDDLADGSGQAPISWILDSVYTRRPMDDRDEFCGGYENCQMRVWLNDDFMHQCSDELQAVVKPVRKAAAESFVVDRFWLYSEQEVFGRKVYAKQAEGRWYAYFAQESILYTALYENTPVWWWLRSPSCYYSNLFCEVLASGAYDYNAAYCSGGVRPGFCV